MSENNYKTISFIVPTLGRESLKKTLASVETWPGDELLVIQHNPPSGNWGNAERQEGTDKAKCDYLAFIDDDDVYVPGVRKIMDTAINESPEGTPILFKMQYPSGRTLWRNKRVKNGNVGAPMILVPNNKEKIWGWDQKYSWADFHFINRWKWGHWEINWRPEVPWAQR
jgi:glycosyltransferase involved in cell wall biosynthesis